MLKRKVSFTFKRKNTLEIQERIYRQAEPLIRGELRIFDCVPEFHDVSSAQIALGEPRSCVPQGCGGFFIAYQNFGLYATNAGKCGKLID